MAPPQKNSLWGARDRTQSGESASMSRPTHVGGDPGRIGSSARSDLTLLGRSDGPAKQHPRVADADRSDALGAGLITLASSSRDQGGLTTQVPRRAYEFELAAHLVHRAS